MELNIEYGTEFLSVNVPYPVVIKGMKNPPAALDAIPAIEQSLKSPMDKPSLLEVAKEKLRLNAKARAVIVVSDNTRPVPYRPPYGIMAPIINTLLEAGFETSQITILIGAGSHRNMEPPEIEKMLGLEAAGLADIYVENHEYEKDEQLQYLGKTKRGSVVKINKRYMEADLKIVTGLVESHFMAGASGGRKGICPGIVGKETLEIFHGAKMLSSNEAADLIIEGNPLSDESLEVAKMAGCDFLVNATIDAEKRLTGIFSGDLETAHREAVKKIREYVVVELDKKYDIVFIPAGFVGVNHYQAGKAAIEAARALKPGGSIIIVARHIDPDPVGGQGYKDSLQLLHQHGRKAFVDMISAPEWKMIQEQWQVQMWCKVLEVMGDEKNLIYCSLEIPNDGYDKLPGIPGINLLTAEELSQADSREVMKSMILKSIEYIYHKNGDVNAEMLFLKDGPYGIPEVKP